MILPIFSWPLSSSGLSTIRMPNIWNKILYIVKSFTFKSHFYFKINSIAKYFVNIHIPGTNETHARLDGREQVASCSVLWYMTEEDTI